MAEEELIHFANHENDDQKRHDHSGDTENPALSRFESHPLKAGFFLVLFERIENLFSPTVPNHKRELRSNSTVILLHSFLPAPQSVTGPTRKLPNFCLSDASI